jgi:hypothetical protein
VQQPAVLDDLRAQRAVRMMLDTGLPVIVNTLLPIEPSDADNIVRSVRHGLADIKANGWQGLIVLAALSLGLALLVSTWHRRREW